MSGASTKSRVFVVSAPSGTGKTTLNRRLVSTHPARVALSVSYTTRKRREAETDGLDYHFVSKERFRALIDQGRLLEYAEVFSTLYGTALDEIERITGQGLMPILEIDVQGWQKARSKLPHAKAIFILPPSVEALWQRLAGRGTEAVEVRWQRLMTARAEIACGHFYDHFIVNQDLETAYEELQDIVINGKSSRLSPSDGARICEDLLAEFDASPWLTKLSLQLTDKKPS